MHALRAPTIVAALLLAACRSDDGGDASGGGATSGADDGTGGDDGGDGGDGGSDGADETAGDGGAENGCPWTLTPLGTPVSSTAHVRVFFSVADVAGNPIPGLSCSDFEALENSEPVDVFESALSVRPPEGNVRIPTVLVLDLSRSVVDAGALETVKDSARAVIDSLTAAQELAILTFAGEATLRSDFTTDTEALHAAIDAITMEDGVSTNLYGALVQGYTMWQDGFIEVGEGPTEPISCVPGLPCSDAPGSQSCEEYCTAQGYASCDELCDAQFGSTTGCEGACMAQGYASCGQYCMESGYPGGCDAATLSCEVPSSEGMLTAGLMIVISDGNDTAAVTTLDQVLAARASKRTLFIAVGAEYDIGPASQIANAGLFDAEDFGQLEAEVTEVIQKAEALGNSIYVAEYCSPKRAGTHTFSLVPPCQAESPEAACAPTGTGPSCNGGDVYCGNTSDTMYVCCDIAYPYHCPGSCYATAEDAMFACGSQCGACGVSNDGTGSAGATIDLSFAADAFSDEQCADLFEAASACD